MDVTFISIHDMSKDARVLYASDSIEYILGYQPHEVINRSCWDYFHPEEMPFAQSVHGRGVRLDKAAILRYCRVKHKLGFWVCCECVFSVVYNVLVACTSVYRQGVASQKRAVDAPIVRRMFTSSPQDPRYHMLSYLSNKFTQVPTNALHEPRAALFLNRFTRTLNIMFATDGVTEILGLEPRQLVSKSFYFCIQERSLQEAVRCLESAKANNSIAYLRFWYRNPLDADAASDPFATDTNALGNDNNAADPRNTRHAEIATNLLPSMNPYSSQREYPNPGVQTTSRPYNATHEAATHRAPQQQNDHNTIEVEAVVSCTSDGLVVVLRRARPFVPLESAPSTSQPTGYPNGIFASPWATQPMVPQYPQQMHMPMQSAWNPGYHPYPMPTNPGISYPGYGYAYGQPMTMPNPMIPATAPMGPSHAYPHAGYSGSSSIEGGGPHPHEFFSTIRDVAVFAWGIVGINGSLEQYRKGQPSGDALPPDGIPIWNPKQAGLELPDEIDFAIDDTVKDAGIKVETEQQETIRRDELA